MADTSTEHAWPTTAPLPRDDRRCTWLLGVAVLFALRLVGDFVPLMSATGWRWTTRLAELWLAGGLLVWAWRSVPNAEVAAGIGRRRLAAVGLIFLAVSAGQFAGPGSEAYPSCIGTCTRRAPTGGLRRGVAGRRHRRRRPLDISAATWRPRPGRSRGGCCRKRRPPPTVTPRPATCSNGPSPRRGPGARSGGPLL